MNSENLREQMQDYLHHLIGEETELESEERQVMEETDLLWEKFHLGSLDVDNEKELEDIQQMEITEDVCFMSLSLIQPHQFRKIALRQKLTIFMYQFDKIHLDQPKEAYLQIIMMLSNYLNFIITQGQTQGEFEVLYSIVISFYTKMSELGYFKGDIKVGIMRLISLLGQINIESISVEAFIQETYNILEIKDQFMEIVNIIFRTQKQTKFTNELFQKTVKGVLLRAEQEIKRVVPNDLERKSSHFQHIAQAFLHMIETPDSQRSIMIHGNIQFLSLFVIFCGKFKQKALLETLLGILIIKKRFKELERVVIIETLKDYNFLIESVKLQRLFDDQEFLIYLVANMNSQRFKDDLCNVYLRSETGCSFILQFVIKILQLEKEKNVEIENNKSIVNVLQSVCFFTQIKFFLSIQQIRIKMELITEVGSNCPHNQLFVEGIQKALRNIPEKTGPQLRRLRM